MIKVLLIFRKGNIKMLIISEQLSPTACGDIKHTF